MAHGLALTLLAAAATDTVLLLLQLLVLRRHLGAAPAAPTGRPGISILKPLCGVDDELDRNLACFAALDWPDHEVLLLHLAGSVAPGVVAAQALAGQDIVVGKSMAFRREDLAALGGFESAKDVLAEDYVLGRRVSRVLGKRVALARRPIQNVSVSRCLGDFLARQGRWSVLHRTTTGRLVHLAQACLNPVLLGAAALTVDPGPLTLGAFGGLCVAKTAIDGACGRALRPGGFGPVALGLVPLKDLVYGLAWARGLVRSHVDWRGHRIRVLSGTRIEAASPAGGAAALTAASRAS